MAGQPGAGRGPGRPEIIKLGSVPGFVVLDLGGVVAGVPFEDLLTGYGVAVAAETALRAGPGGGWEGRSVAIEGFGKAGGGAAREVASRGGRVAAVSTVAGCVVDPSGLDVERLLALREVHGDACVLRYGLPAGPPGRLFTAVDADVIIPGAQPGVISRPVAEPLPSAVQVVAPAANVPYTREGADTLHRRGIAALPDFVCNAGAAWRALPTSSPRYGSGGSAWAAPCLVCGRTPRRP